jgi:hypothetical protein
VMPDMAGDALLEEIDHPRSYPVIREFLKKCAGAVVLIDSIDLHGSNRDQDYFAMKLLTYLDELDEDHGKRAWRQRPLALVFSKADECEECFADPAGHAQHAAGVWRFCQERFRDYRFFAAGVAGACAERDAGRDGVQRVPLRIEPRGVVAPFLWLVSRLHNPKGPAC